MSLQMTHTYWSLPFCISHLSLIKHKHIKIGLIPEDHKYLNEPADDPDILVTAVLYFTLKFDVFSAAVGTSLHGCLQSYWAYHTAQTTPPRLLRCHHRSLKTKQTPYINYINLVVFQAMALCALKIRYMVGVFIKYLGKKSHQSIFMIPSE